MIQFSVLQDFFEMYLMLIKFCEHSFTKTYVRQKLYEYERLRVLVDRYNNATKLAYMDGVYKEIKLRYNL